MAGQGSTSPAISSSVNIVEELTPSGRGTRRPNHTFQVEHRPYEIQPFMIAPVMPGDTLTNALLQCTAVSDPIKNPLIGWYLEHYLFYVKLTDLDDRDYFRNLMISASATLSSASFWNSSADVSRYKAAIAGYDFVGACLKRVAEEWFRDEDEAWNVAVFDTTVPLAKANIQDSWMQSLSLDATEETPNPIQGPAEPVWDDYLEQWQKMRELRLIDLTYEEWLKAHGITGVVVEKRYRPELLRYSRAFTPPSNTVDPATGTPSSAAYWKLAERADKRRLFKEPGFIFGVTVARPKVYMSKQVQNASSFMDDAYAWLPAMLRDSPETSLKKFTSAIGPLAGNVAANTYWVDRRDLLLYGDQFVNFALSETDNGLMALPGSALTKAAMRYATLAMVEALFTNATTSGLKPGRTIRQDGIVGLNIKSANSVDFT